MATKTPVPNRNAPDFSALFNWGLKLTDFSELFLMAGLGDHGPDGAIRNPDDPVAQTRAILDDVAAYITENAYAKDDIVRVEFTMTKDVDPSRYEAIFGLFAEFFADLSVKPAAGTLRVIDGLALPGMMVEYEFWLAK